MSAGWGGMHQPVDHEWDHFAGLLPELMAPQVTHGVTSISTQPVTQQPVAQAVAEPMVAQQTYSSWSSMHQPVEWDFPVHAPSAHAAPEPSSAAPASTSRPKETGTKRERAGRRGKPATLRPQQQQMLDLQKKLDALLQEHAVVEAENTRLKTRLRVLEAVLPARESQSRPAHSSQPARASSKEESVIASLLDLAHAPSSCCGTSSPRRYGGSDDGERTKSEYAPRSPEQAATTPDPGPCNSGVVCSSCCFGAAGTGEQSQPTATTSTPIHPASHAENEARWIEAWRAWVREAALLLQAHDARPNEMYVKRIDEAFQKLKSEAVSLGLRHPELICNMRQVNMETGAEREVPPEGFWSVVAAGMKLSSTQIAECRSALQLYRERMSVVLSERRGLTSQLSSCLGALALEEAEGRAAPGSLRREQLTLEAEEVAAALDSNVATEGHTTSLARDLLGSNLFSRTQVARASVLSYPYFPDALAIISTAVAEAEKPATSGGGGAPAPTVTEATRA